MFQKIKQKISNNKVAVITSIGACVSLVSSVAHADTGDDMSTITTAITTGLSSGKTDLVACMAAVLVIGLAIYMLKFGARQALNFFSMIANKK